MGVMWLAGAYGTVNGWIWWATQLLPKRTFTSSATHSLHTWSLQRESAVGISGYTPFHLSWTAGKGKHKGAPSLSLLSVSRMEGL